MSKIYFLQIMCNFNEEELELFKGELPKDSPIFF